MKLTILGNNGPYPGPGGACSGYLLEEGETRVLIDCGSGVLANLQKVTAINKISAVVLTHLHNDHMSDMLVLKYAVEVGKSRGLSFGALDVWAPPEPLQMFNFLKSGSAFNVNPITPDIKLTKGELEITFAKMSHSVLCYGVSCTSGNRKFVFSGDTSWDDELEGFFRGSDVLMLDAGLLERDRTETAPHMTAAECGIMAARINTGKLLLTHLWPGYDVCEVEAEAAEHYADAKAVKILQQISIK